MRFLTLVPVALCAAFVIGCKSGDSATTTPDSSTTEGAQKSPPAGVAKTDTKNAGQLAGTWTNVTADAGGAKTAFTFDAGGTYSMMALATPPGQKSPFKTTMKGTYTLDGDKLAMHITALSVSSDDPKMKPDIDKANEAAKDTSKLPEMSGKIEFKDKNDATVTMEPPAGTTEKPQVIELKRKV